MELRCPKCEYTGEIETQPEQGVTIECEACGYTWNYSPGTSKILRSFGRMSLGITVLFTIPILLYAKDSLTNKKKADNTGDMVYTINQPPPKHLLQCTGWRPFKWRSYFRARGFKVTTHKLGGIKAARDGVSIWVNWENGELHYVGPVPFTAMNKDKTISQVMHIMNRIAPGIVRYVGTTPEHWQNKLFSLRAEFRIPNHNYKITSNFGLRRIGSEK